MRVISVLRIFCAEKAREFSLDSMGCHLVWEQRVPENLLPHLQVSRELSSMNYSYERPGPVEAFSGTSQRNFIEPFGNRIHFCEPQPHWPVSR